MTCTIISTGEELKLVCKNENEPPYPEIKAKLREKIWELYCKGYDRFWINCEYGVPLWCGEIITALAMYNDIELNIAMPYEEQSTNWVPMFRGDPRKPWIDINSVKILFRHLNMVLMQEFTSSIDVSLDSLPVCVFMDKCFDICLNYIDNYCVNNNSTLIPDGAYINETEFKRSLKDELASLKIESILKFV